jgi:hypothetical protein
MKTELTIDGDTVSLVVKTMGKLFLLVTAITGFLVFLLLLVAFI